MPSLLMTTGGGGGLAIARRRRPELGGGASAGKRDRDGDAAVPRHPVDRGRQGRLDEDVDRPAARQPDVPRLLVADPVADHPGVAVAPGPLDLLGRGALDAAAADGARDPAVVGAEQHGALGSRRASRTSGRRPPGRCRHRRPATPQRGRTSFIERSSGRRRFASGSGRQSRHSGRSARARSASRPAIVAAAADWSTDGLVGATRPAQSGVSGRSRIVSGAGAGIGRGGRFPAPRDVARADRRRGSRRGARGWRRSRPAGSRRCTETPRASRRRAARSHGVPASGLSQTSRWQLRRRRAVSVATSIGSPRSQPSDTTMTMPLVRSVRRAQRRLNSRNDSPIRVPPAQSLTASATRGERAIAVAVAKQPRHPGQLRPEHERLRLDRRRRRQRLDEPQQQPRMALHRARDVAQDDDLARPLDRSPPDPFGELAARREVAPEHRPRGEQAAVVVELVSARPAQLESRLEQVDEPLGVAQLGRGHAVEVAMAERLRGAVRVGRGDVPVDVGLVDRLVAAGHRQRDAVDGALLARLARRRVRQSRPSVSSAPGGASSCGAAGSGRPSFGGAGARWRHQRSKTRS